MRIQQACVFNKARHDWLLGGGWGTSPGSPPGTARGHLPSHSSHITVRSTTFVLKKPSETCIERCARASAEPLRATVTCTGELTTEVIETPDQDAASPKRKLEGGECHAVHLGCVRRRVYGVLPCWCSAPSLVSPLTANRDGDKRSSA